MDRSGVRILIVDDHEIFRAGLRLLLENEPDLNVIGEAHNKIEAFQAVRNLPDVILLDLDLGAEMATDFLPDLVKASEPARVLVLTGVPDPELHFQAVRLGAVGEKVRSHYGARSEEHTSELQSPCNLVCRLLLEKKKKKVKTTQQL